MNTIFWLWCLACFVQFAFWVILFIPLLLQARHKNTDLTSNMQLWPAVTVIVVVKNELTNLKVLLTELFAQKYAGNWDIHILDDNSTDKTKEFVQSLAPNGISLFFHESESGMGSGKKHQLNRLDTIFTNDLLLFTDADCRPGNNWIRSMVSALQDADIVLGYSPYLKQTGLMNGLVQLETQITALLYLAMANNQKSYMGVGRNILYKKQVFLSGEAISKYKKLLSGDDDLTVNELANRSKIKISLDPESFVSSTPKTNWKSWYHQKARHITTARYYKVTDQIILSCFYGSFVGVFVLGLAMLFDADYTITVLFAILLYYFIFGRLTKILLKYEWQLIEWIQGVYYWIISLFLLSPYTYFKKVEKW